MTGSFESFLRRDNSPAYTEEWKRAHIKYYTLEDLRKKDIENGKKWLKWIFMFCLAATAAYMYIPTAHAETITSKDVYNAPDAVQEATYCAIALQGREKVVGAGQLKTFCNNYGG